MKLAWIKALCTSACVISTLPTYAAWPDKPIKFVIPYAPGGAADVLGRTLAGELSTRLKQQIIVENKAGAGGTIAAQAVLQAPADGYTFLYDASAFSVNQSLFPKLSFDYAKDFAPIAMVARVPTLLVVPANSPANTVADLVQRARTKAGAVNYASAGHGSAAHLAAELFAQGHGVSLVHVPYKGGGPALADLVGGQVEMFFSTISTCGPLVRAGKLKALATGSDRRVESMPQLPTVAELGLPGFSAFEWNGVWAAAATPQDVLRRMEAEIAAALASPAFLQRLSDLGAQPATGMNAKEFADFVRKEMSKWAGVVKTANIKID